MRFLVLLALVLSRYHTASTVRSLAALPYTLEELIPLRPEYFPDRLTVQWTSDSEYVFSEPNLGIRKYNAPSDFFANILDVTELVNLSRYSVSSFSQDENYLLLATNKKKVYRYSSIAEYSVYDTVNNKTLVPIAKEPLQVVVWGSGNSLAYVKDNNVYYVPNCARPDIFTALTTDGIPGEVYNGVTDWIYEEEVFNAAEALWFSPRGTYLAVASFNDTLVESASYPFYGYPTDITYQYTQEIRFKYPKAGRANPVVGLRVFKPNEPSTDAWNIPAPIDVVGTDHILARVSWATDNNLLVLWLNRRQNASILMSCNLLKDKCTIVKEQVEHGGWIDVSEAFFDSIGNQMVQIEPLYSSGKRYMHAALYDFQSRRVTDLTPGNATVMEILSWNGDKDLLYYIVSPEEEPWLRQLWVAKGGVQRCMSCKDPSCRSVSAMISTEGSYGVVTCSASNKPPKTFLYSSRVDRFQLIKDNSRLAEKLGKYKVPLVLFNKIKLAFDVTAHVKLLLPPEAKNGGSYPMIVRVYAGPGTTRVKDSYDLEYYNLYLATNRSFIVASIDVRGSGAMDVDSLHAVNNALGTVEVTDTLEAIRQLVKLYKMIDPKKIGVWGWSYGGFTTTMMLVQDEQRILSCGAAVAPVTSWLYYDSIYTERYMDLPSKNHKGYAQSDLMSSAQQLRGRKYLLVHGTGDDNVHFQHSLQLAKVLQHADIEFQQMSYTDENHSLMGVNRHFYHTLDHFWTECFESH